MATNELEQLYFTLIEKSTEKACDKDTSLPDLIEALCFFQASCLEAKDGAVAAAIETISKALEFDEGLALSWHANLAMAFIDAGCDPVVAQNGATVFMSRAFCVDYKGDTNE